MNFTEEQLEVLYDAWTLYPSGKGLVPKYGHLPACERLAQQGWLRREIHEDVAFFWTDHAEAKLDTHNLFETARASVN